MISDESRYSSDEPSCILPYMHLSEYGTWRVTMGDSVIIAWNLTYDQAWNLASYIKCAIINFFEEIDYEPRLKEPETNE